MLGLLVASGFSKLHPTCDIPYKFPEPLNTSEYIPEHMEIVLRHGARTPITMWLKTEERGKWQCDADDARASRIEVSPRKNGRRVHKIFEERLSEYPTNCNAGDLTVEGMEQHLKLGAAFREYALNKIKLIPEYYDPRLISARATWYERTYRSGVSFLQGLYPVQDSNEYIDFLVGTKNRDTVHPNNKMCPDLKKLSADFFASSTYMDVHNEVMKYAQPLYDLTGNTDKSPEGLESMCDWAITYYCNEQKLFPIITDELIEQCRKVQAYHFYRISFFNETQGCVGGGPIFRQLFKNYDERGEKKLDVIAAHDSVIAFVLSSLGIGGDWVMTPPYASYITMETYLKDDKTWIRFTYNGEVVNIFNRYQIMEIGEFRSAIQNVLQNCYPDLP